MFDKRLFTLAPGIGRLVAGKVALMWLGLLANVAFVVTLLALLGDLLRWFDPHAAAAATIVSPTRLPWYLLVFAIIAAVRYLTTRGATRLGFEAAERVKLSLRERLYRKMLALGPSYSARVKTADVVQSAGEGIEQIQSFFELFLPQLCYAVLAPLTLFAVLLPVNVPAAVTLLACAPLIVVIVGLVAMSAARVFKKYWGKYTDMGAAFLDNLQGLATLKIFDADGRAAREMDRKAEEFRVMTMNVLQIQLRSLTAMDLVAYGGSAAGIGVAIWQLATGSLGLPGALMIVLLSADFFIPLRQLGSYFHVAMNGMTSTKRIFALLDAPEPRHGDVELADSRFAPAVAFEQTGFTYGGAAESALHDVTFLANPGQVTAIVGVSGSGKSTAAALLAGTLTGYDGSIALLDMHGKHEIRDLSARSLTRTVTLVGARSHLFAGTLRENLLMACHDGGDGGDGDEVADDVLWDALRRARIDDFVRSQPDGLDMTIEPDSANLSGGQRQRLAIARALLHGGSVMVFDEATSSVDAESEALILASIRDLAKAGKTVIMITHRMANSADADMIIVFDHGDVIESGLHRGLIATDGTYARLYRAQQSIEQVGRRADATAPVPRTENDPVSPAPAEKAIRPRAKDSSATASAAPAMTAPTSTAAASESAASPTSLPLTALIPRLLREARPLARFMVMACVFGTLGHLAATFLPVFGAMALLAVLGHPVWGLGVAASVAGMAVCALIRGLMRYTEQFMNHNVAFRLLALFRSKAFAALRRLAPAKLDGKGKGDLIALITTDVEMLEIFFAHTISPVVIAAATTVVYIVALLTLSPWMALVLIVAHLTIGVLLPFLFARAVRGIGDDLRRESSALDDRVLDGMRGIGEIIRFGAGAARVADIVSRTRDLWAKRAKLSRVNGHYAGVGGVLVLAFTTIAALAAVGGGATISSAAAPSLIVAVILIASSFGPTLALSALPANLTNTFAAARRLFALMDETPAVTETGTAAPAYNGMALDHVTFAYPAATGVADPISAKTARSGRTENAAASAILNDYSLAIPRTGILGVQGPSGRGKSTMLKLLMRYWDPQSGTVTMSGTPLPTVDMHHRRTIQTMMSQETALFDGTIRDNLLIALPVGSNDMDVARHVTEASTGHDGDPADSTTHQTGADTDALLRDACRKASVLELIDSLAQGFDTPVGELGDRLSEGERQRIGLARIFLRNADLVLFDEPTSRLDALNEAVILQSINTLATEHDAAIVLVSHRESAMRIADRVVAV